jgi:hypothetical protein
MKLTETVTAPPAIPEGRTLVATDNLGGALYPPSTARAGTEGIWRSLFSSKWTLFAVVLALGAVLLPVLRSIHNFLAVSSPIGQGILVVEGWIPTGDLAECLRLFNSGHYRYVIVVGGAIPGTGSESTPDITWDEVAANKLEELGLDPSKLIRISVPPVEVGHRTFASAIAVRRWLSRSGGSFSVDVVTAGVHARKSWTAFRYALGDHYRVGIISGTEYAYDPRFWFFSKTGIWYVVRDLAGFMYSKLWIRFNTQDFATLHLADPIVNRRFSDFEKFERGING